MANNSETFDIGLSYPDDITDDEINNELEEIRFPNLKFKIHKHPTGMFYMALEWVIPTAFIIYIFRSYFDSFLKEAGKDHYVLLKKWVKDYFKKRRYLKVIKLSSSPAKLDPKNSQSNVLSVVVETINQSRIKFLFDEALTENDWNDAIDQIFSLLEENYRLYPNDLLTLRLKNLKHERPYEVYAIINCETKQWMFYDQNQIGRLRLNAE